MKIMRTVLFITLVSLLGTVRAQSADEILNTYFENTGGYDAWKNLSGLKIKAKVNQGGIEIPLEIVQLKDGRQYTKITIQGQVIMQGVFDGTTLWNTNFASMKAEKADEESTANAKLDANDFPDSFFDYKSKGYNVELAGKEAFDGADTYKLKLTREPRTVDGAKVDDVQYFFFEVDSSVPIGQESEVRQGPAKGQIQQIKMSDYQEVGGLYFAHAMTQGLKGGESQPIIVESIEVNPTVSDSDFAFPN
ncbi:MAG: outer membrane lipoprotein-sorting protein [Cyclobacteriaceae bacterium]